MTSVMQIRDRKDYFKYKEQPNKGNKDPMPLRTTPTNSLTRIWNDATTYTSFCSIIKIESKWYLLIFTKSSKLLKKKNTVSYGKVFHNKDHLSSIFGGRGDVGCFLETQVALELTRYSSR